MLTNPGNSPGQFESVARTAEDPTGGNGCLHLLVLVLVQGWVISVAFLHQFILLLTSIQPESLGPQHHLLAAGVQVLLVLLPLVLLAGFYRTQPYRRIYLVWALAASSMLLYLPASLVDPISSQARTILHLPGLALLLILILVFRRDDLFKRPSPNSTPLPESSQDKSPAHPDSRLIHLVLLLTLALYALPWLAWGALGSLFDSLLGVVLGISFGVVSFFLLEYLARFTLSGRLAKLANPAASYFLLGFSASTALYLLASGAGFPFGSLPLVLMLLAAVLGWLYGGVRLLLARSLLDRDPAAVGSELLLNAGNRAFLAAFLGFIFTLPLTLFDPDELGLFLGFSLQEILRFAFQSAAAGSLVLVLSALLAAAMLAWKLMKASAEPSSQPARTARLLFPALALSLAASAFLFYLRLGQPGFHGERLFVILDSQADLSSIDPQAPASQRRQLVYDSLTGHALASQGNLRRQLDAFGIDYTPYYLVNALEVPDSPLLRLWLAFRPEIDRVLPSPRLRPLPFPVAIPSAAAPQQPPQQLPPNLLQVKAEQVWKEFGLTGQGVVVGLADSGAQLEHPNLSGSYRGRHSQHDLSWLDPWYGESSPVDPSGHGTHVLGIILGKYTGVAPGAEWIACANLPRNLGNPALYLDCWQFLFAPYPTGGDPFTRGAPGLGAQVINNSWGCPRLEGCDPQTFHSAVSGLRTAGIFLVVSAGNDGPTCSSLHTPPAQYDQVFSVGAVDGQGSLATFSSLGPLEEALGSWNKPDLVAPGVRILSSFPGSTYQEQSGTSMSGPHVAGVVALMWSANPSLVGNIAATERILRESAAPYSGQSPECPGAAAFPSSATGYGLLDAYGAVLLALDAEN